MVCFLTPETKVATHQTKHENNINGETIVVMAFNFKALLNFLAPTPPSFYKEVTF